MKGILQFAIFYSPLYAYILSGGWSDDGAVAQEAGDGDGHRGLDGADLTLEDMLVSPVVEGSGVAAGVEYSSPVPRLSLERATPPKSDGAALWTVTVLRPSPLRAMLTATIYCTPSRCFYAVGMESPGTSMPLVTPRTAPKWEGLTTHRRQKKDWLQAVRISVAVSYRSRHIAPTSGVCMS
jgi:hypothetical protein